MRDSPPRRPITPPIAEATRQLMTPAPAAPDRDCYVTIVRSPRRRILQVPYTRLTLATDSNVQISVATNSRKKIRMGTR